MDDLTAIDKCRSGETDAFNHLVRKYQSEAIGHAVVILGSREDALDAVQHAFMDAYRTLERFDVSRRFYPWLYTILRNRCFKMLAYRAKHAAVNLDEIEILAQPKKDSSSIAVSLVERALCELSPEDRELLTLKHLDGLRYNELAERLGLPSGTVMSRLYYARKRFREKVVRIRERLDSKEINNE
ncbi:MAG: RNA polymerase sigma factor [Planctomycetota bacterium]|jgi:RNA polymerase sigma-70 factor (ECF subfamily)